MRTKSFRNFGILLSRILNQFRTNSGWRDVRENVVNKKDNSKLIPLNLNFKLVYLSASFDTTLFSRTLDFSFQMSSGFSCDPSYICRQASTDFRMASKNISGKNFDNAIRTFGPINLSEDILLKTSADRSRIKLSWALQKMCTRHTMPPGEK